MESITLPYKTDDYGKPLLAKVCWSNDVKLQDKAKPIVIIFHGGGMIVGSFDIIPQVQLQYLVSQNFLVVIPNYRLSPQVSASEGGFADAASTLQWAQTQLPAILKAQHSITVDPARVGTMGHSTGGTIALWLAARSPTTVKATTAFYPSLYTSDITTDAHKPYSGTGFVFPPDFDPTPENLAALSPPDTQVSSAPLAPPGVPPTPRNIWQVTHIKHGTWLKAIQPDGKYNLIDPCTLFATVGANWPPTMLVQGEEDQVPGSGLAAAERAVKELKEAGATDVRIEKVAGAAHMFDIMPTIGTADLGPKWVAVKRALDFLTEKV
ncbi:MAG: hypothetical protein M1834_008044 [Cirrosporium novae-zelandiae]|nr:MAG: hypothetical protein M1834_008044 [Cirrosporium novae-zelandiae]